MNQQTTTTNQASQDAVTKTHQDAPCCHFPDFTRLKYFYGQMLGQHDFQTEQDYFRNKLRLHNRCLHGYGVVCGLEVVPEPMTEDCPHPSHDENKKLKAELEAIEQRIKDLENRGPQTGKEEEYKKEIERLREQAEEIRRRLEQVDDHECIQDEPTRVQIECGFALDCHGDELLVRRPMTIDLWQSLSADDRRRVNEDGQDIYISICYCALPVDPVRPVLMDTCGGSSECTYGKVKDSIKLRISLDPPETDERCETCCESCGDACVLLARIDDFKRGEPLTVEQIDNSVRRMVGPYAPVTITGISWTHGAEYTVEEATGLLGRKEKKGGIKIQFSRPVLTETLARGVIDIWVMELGAGRSGNIYNMEGEYVDLPNTPTTDWVKFRQKTRETLQEGDRVLIIVRTSFILDECCHPVDGDHIGGRVPILLPDYKDYERGEPPTGCVHPPQRSVPWTSGDGTGGGTFESWFYIKPSETNEEESY